jgi:hypothetical protein
VPVVAPISADKVIELAASQLGVHEDPAKSNITPYSTWYGSHDAWCAMFCSWTLHHAGFPIRITTKKGFARCTLGVEFFKAQGAWADKNAKPKRGWLVFFDFPNDEHNRVSHVGFVEGVRTDGRIACIEGNTNGSGSRDGGSVMRHNRTVAGGIVGYGIIEYTAARRDSDMAVIYHPTSGPDAEGVWLVGSHRTRIPSPTELTELEKVYGKTVEVSGGTWNVIKANAPLRNSD